MATAGRRGGQSVFPAGFTSSVRNLKVSGGSAELSGRPGAADRAGGFEGSGTGSIDGDAATPDWASNFRTIRLLERVRNRGAGGSGGRGERHGRAGVWTGYFPELPKPFSARRESSRASTSAIEPVRTGTGIIWAIFSPAARVMGCSPRFVMRMRISPR